MKLSAEISQDPLEVIYNAIIQSDRDWSSDGKNREMGAEKRGTTKFGSV
jgi:hypothetical protein